MAERPQQRLGCHRSVRTRQIGQTDSGAIAGLVVGVISPIGGLPFHGVTGIILGSVAVFLAVL